MKSSQKPTDFEQNNDDVTSIPDYVFKKKKTEIVDPNTDITKDKKILPSETDAEQSTSQKERKPPNKTLTIVRQRNEQGSVVRHRVERIVV